MEHPAVKEAIAAAETLLGDDGRLLVRPSGTEQVVRVMAEHSSKDTCEEAVALVIDAIRANCR